MALTLEADQRLEATGLTAFYLEDQAAWLTMTRQTKAFITQTFPDGSVIRRDDIAKAMVPLLEVHAGLREYLDSNKIKAKYWIRDFADLIVDRTWESLDGEQ